MASANLIHLIGRVGSDPKIYEGGKGAAAFSLATTRGSRDRQVTDWHNIKAFDTSAYAGRFVADYVRKGDLVSVLGKLTYNEYEKEGVKTRYAEIIATDVQLLSKRGDGRQDGRDGYQGAPAPQQRTQKRDEGQTTRVQQSPQETPYRRDSSYTPDPVYTHPPKRSARPDYEPPEFDGPPTYDGDIPF